MACKSPRYFFPRPAFVRPDHQPFTQAVFRQPDLAEGQGFEPWRALGP